MNISYAAYKEWAAEWDVILMDWTDPSLQYRQSPMQDYFLADFGTVLIFCIAYIALVIFGMVRSMDLTSVRISAKFPTTWTNKQADGRTDGPSLPCGWMDGWLLVLTWIYVCLWCSCSWAPIYHQSKPPHCSLCTIHCKLSCAHTCVLKRFCWPIVMYVDDHPASIITMM